MKPTMSSRLDEIVQESGDPFHCSSYLLQDTYHQRHGTKPSMSSVAKALTRARNVVRDARPETDDWTWTGRLYQHRRDPEVTLKQSGNWWVMYLGGARVTHWRSTYPARLLDAAAYEAMVLLGVPDAAATSLASSYDGIREVYKYGL